MTFCPRTKEDCRIDCALYLRNWGMCIEKAYHLREMFRDTNSKWAGAKRMDIELEEDWPKPISEGD